MKTDKPRFKIDIFEASFFPIGLFLRETTSGLFRTKDNWRIVRSFPSIPEAREHYDAIKDLPEYLD